MDRERFTSTKGLLPADSLLEIKGGNHTNFGYYGAQKGDGSAEISREEQHRLTTLLIMTMIASMGP